MLKDKTVLWGSKLDGNSNDVKGVSNGSDTNITYNSGNGKIVQGAGFNGSSSRINTNSSVKSGTGAFTIALWIKSTGTSTVICTKRGAVTENGQWNFLIEGGGHLLFWDYNGSAFQFLTSGTSTSVINDGNWHLVGFTRNGTSGTYYVDGVSNGTKTALSNLSYNTQTVKFGSDDYSASYFNGAQDEPYIFDGVLSDDEWLELYNSGAGKQYPFLSNLNASILCAII